MRYKTQTILMALTACLSLAIPASAHHSFQAEFSVEKPVTISGSITKVEWVNPHAQIYVDVKDSNGQTIAWRIATWDPFVLRKAGLMRNKLFSGEQVKITAYGAKDGTNVAYLRHIWLPDGQEFDLWDSTSNQALDAERKKITETK